QCSNRRAVTQTLFPSSCSEARPLRWRNRRGEQSADLGRRFEHMITLGVRAPGAEAKRNGRDRARGRAGPQLVQRFPLGTV
ncbi:MAG: hypothetical protein WBE50_20240, partial [Methyloceanibacter sp.]